MSEIIASTYEIVARIGAGGGGVVYLANHLRLGKRVVLKADKRKITTRPELLRREVDILKDLSHPYIPQVYDFFVENDVVYTVMDYIEGESLDNPLKRGERYPQAQVIKWARQLLEALQYLHSPIHGNPPKGYVHSDIKPANLMRRPNNDICLIDFNIALALGEENVIGCSAGYASPEHYGLDFSTDGAGTATIARGTDTVARGDETVTLAVNSSSSSSMRKRAVLPDVRSDIYSVGATLYHLLSGQRPSRSALEVVPLSTQEFSPQIVHIISKSMNPNPDLRYQTAEEMLYDLNHLHENDPRLIKWKKGRHVAAGAFGAFLVAGVACAFLGLRRMQISESWLKMAEYSRTALSEGDTVAAIDYALQAIPEKSSLFVPPYPAEAQLALTDALGVYDLSDGFKTDRALELPAAPFKLAASPQGSRFAAVYAFEAAVFEMEDQEKIASLPIQESALSDCLFVDEDRIVYAGADGVSVYDLEKGEAVWTGEAATTLALSADASRVAAVDRDAERVVVYQASDGQVVAERSFDGKHLPVAANDIFADPEDALFALNADGTLLAASFSDGALMILDVEDPEGDMILFDESQYRHFEGGFCGKYLAFAAGGTGDALFGMVDTMEASYLGGFESQDAFHLKAGEDGIYLATGSLLERVEVKEGAEAQIEEQELAYAENAYLTGFAIGQDYILTSMEDGSFAFYDSGAHLSSLEAVDVAYDFLEITADHAILGSRNDPVLRLMKLEGHEDAQLLKYDARYVHDEARISADGKTAMLFSNFGFRIYDMDGSLVTEVEIPDPDTIYDQQFRKEDDESYLEVIWYDGTVRCYSAQDGTVVSEETREAPDKDLEEEFTTDRYRIASSLHDAPQVYDLKSGKFVASLEADSYLTYVTQVGEYLITEYISTSGDRYGILLDEDLQKLAYLPNLCDVMDGETLVFDYESGNLRQSRLYSIRELVTLGEKY